MELPGAINTGSTQNTHWQKGGSSPNLSWEGSITVETSADLGVGAPGKEWLQRKHGLLRCNFGADTVVLKSVVQKTVRENGLALMGACEQS